MRKVSFSKGKIVLDFSLIFHVTETGSVVRSLYYITIPNARRF